MMKMLMLPLLAAVVFALVLAARGEGPSDAPADPRDWPVQQVIEYGESVVLPGGSVLQFVDVVEDSRCPADATCIWQGRAVVALALDGERFEVDFRGPDGSAVEVGGLTVEVQDVQPYPLASQPADEHDYRVTVRVAPAE